MSQFLVNTGYFLMLAGFLVRDILWLRSLLIAAQLSLSLYGLRIGQMPIFYWNAIMVLINCIWVVRIVAERRPVTIPTEWQTFYDKIFRAMSPKEFLQFWGMGRIMEKNADFFVRAGEKPDDLMLVIEGDTEVVSNQRVISRLLPGRFVADMSFLTGQAASADVRAIGPVRVMAWNQSDLRALQSSQPGLFMKLQGAIGVELAEKIRAANLQLEKLVLNT